MSIRIRFLTFDTSFEICISNIFFVPFRFLQRLDDLLDLLPDLLVEGRVADEQSVAALDMPEVYCRPGGTVNNREKSQRSAFKEHVEAKNPHKLFGSSRPSPWKGCAPDPHR
jgi:hypothetical protein